MFQHYCLFWGKEPRDSSKAGYKRIEEKCPKEGVKEVVGQDDDYDNIESDPLLGKSREKKPGEMSATLEFSQHDLISIIWTTFCLNNIQL